jgi:tRNA U54 and U55 pseudouridine synthase Pus10
MAFYSMMLLSFNLYEAFKEDVFGAEETEESEARIPLFSYATRLRREVIDIAGKLVKTGRQMVLKVTEATARRLDIERLFQQVADPPRFAWR